MKWLMISLMLVIAVAGCSKQAYGQAGNQLSGTETLSSQYGCKNHPEISASWPAKCPKCQTSLTPTGQQMGKVNNKTISANHTQGMMDRISKSKKMRYKIMLNTPINVFDPEPILGAQKPLQLTDVQIEQLKKISMNARQAAKKVLNPKQQNELTSIDKIPEFPKTMAQYRHRMLVKMKSPEIRMMRNMMQPSKILKPQTEIDPPIEKTIFRFNGNMMDRTVESGDESADGQPRSNLRDRYRDQYRDHYRDRYRDFYRDRYRDWYRDGLRDRYRDEFGDNVDGDNFGNPEGFGGYDGGYRGGDEGFGGYDGGYRGGDEGFGGYDGGYRGGDEGFGSYDGGDRGGDEGFGGDDGGDGGGDEGFGGDDGGDGGDD